MNSESRLKEIAFFNALKTEAKCSNTPEICKRVCKRTHNKFLPCLWDRTSSNASGLQTGRFVFGIMKTFGRKGQPSTTNRSPWSTLES